MTDEASREFVVRSGTIAGSVEVTAKDTLSTVRTLIEDEFDDDMLPSKDWVFWVNGIRKSMKQEARLLAWEAMEKGEIQLVSKKRPVEEEVEASRKRPRQAIVTPAEEASPTQQQEPTKEVMKPLELDSKLREKESSATTTDDSSTEFFDTHEQDAPISNNSGDAAAPCSPSASVDDDATVDMVDTPHRDSDAAAETNPKEPNLPPHRANLEEEDDFVAAIDNPEEEDSIAAIDDAPSTSDDLEDEASVEAMGQDEIVFVDQNPHKDGDEAMTTSRKVLEELQEVLKQNEHFCSETRRCEWSQEIDALLNKDRPQTTIGVLGNTGVGKSSLLNALLDEAAVLPTSGSRGCTAAVVELVFHGDLLKSDAVENAGDTIPVYQGEVEFMKLEDWEKELKVLVDECSTQEKLIYARPPLEANQAAAHAAWQKINQVYGRGAMEQYHGKPTQRVFQMLIRNRRVVELLTPSDPSKDFNSIIVQEGQVEPASEEAKELLKPFGTMKGRTKRSKKKWAQSFRKKINSYVYRMGNGERPQTWPLIRKVQLRGPWTVLSTGACLVDLPGVRDSNAARAKVAETYLQNCNQISIVAPIKRAVDDGTAKELMGEQFKRRLLMDGQYGNVFFICTQTDDLEATETIRDHADVAQQVPGRWDRITDLNDRISSMEAWLNEKEQEEDELKAYVDDALQQWREAKTEMKEAKADSDGNESDVEQLHDALCAAVELKKHAATNLATWRKENGAQMDEEKDKCRKLQKELKAICATVRNEYSKSCLQEDFRSGLKELYRKDDEGDADGANVEQTALPEDYNMEVFCISSNDYLKVMGIKPASDGPSNAFSNPRDTQIPQLRAFVHETTARFCKSHAKSFVESTNDVLDRMKLLASDAQDVPSGRAAYRLKLLFESEMKKLDAAITPIARGFQKQLDHRVKASLTPSLHSGAQKGRAAAMDTVQSWGSTNRRTRHERRPDKNGLYWATYQATVRRDGVYTSAAAGPVDFNQELCDPMEREFSTDWQAVLDSAIRRLLAEAERKILAIAASATKELAAALRHNGMDAARLANMLNTGTRSTNTALKAAFEAMSRLAVDAQRDLNRALLPSVTERMKQSYTAAMAAPGGPGVFNRMKGAVQCTTSKSVHGMFEKATQDIIRGISAVIKQLEDLISGTAKLISKVMENVFSICWDDQSDKGALMDPAMQAKIRACRDALLPELNKLCDVQVGACQLMGIEREELELEMMAVETLEQGLQRRLEDAKKSGNAFDLCDSDAEIDVQPIKRVKAEPESQPKAPTTTSKGAELIDLCDSDDDWTPPPPSGLARTRAAERRIKAEGGFI